MSFLCKYFKIGCPKPPVPPTTPSDRWLSVDVDGPTDFTARMVLDSGLNIQGQRVEPTAPWHMSFRVPGTERGGYYIHITPADDDYEEAVVRGSIGGVSIDQLGAIPTTDCMNDPIVCKEAHFDPSGVSLEDLARIRGAMWTETLDVPFGPRPGQPTNIAATDFLWNYDEPTRKRIVENLRSLGYTHAVVGPFVDSDGYHGIWSPNDWRQKWDQFLDMHQFLWDHGLAPVTYGKPDAWTVEQMMSEMTPFLQQPRAQKLIRIIVPMGWEPGRYDYSSNTWAKACQWARQVLPNALVLLHTVSDVDAPVGTDANGDDNGKDNALGWKRVAPYAHGWLTQTSTYERKDGKDDPSKPNQTNFQNWLDLFNPAVYKSYKDRFTNGRAGWPTNSAWGNRPLMVYAGEYLAYWTFWENAPKEVSRQWGDAVMAAGADGYLDGGTVSVGSGPVPWQK